jgi:microsomal dipeptidase-like Zn-dependent dipeptidase
MLIGRSVKFAGALLLVSACGGGSSGGSTGTDGSAGDGGTTGEPLPALEGVADLHLHMFAEEAFGGGWFHGSAIGPAETALAPCDGGEPGDHGRLRDELAPLLGTCEGMTLEELSSKVPLVETIAVGGGGLVTEFIGAIPGTAGDTGRHDDRTGGWPELDGWPRWDVIAHQQSWEEQLYAAYQGGLRVEVISAVSLNWLCRALPDENVQRPECDEMADVRVQLQMANDFDATHDWAEIALDAAHARQIVAEGRLALILSVEASHILQDGDWRAGLDELYALGVRTLQPVHQLDNRFGGAAPHNTIFQIALYAENCHIDEDCGLTTNTLTLGFDVDAECKNTKGLTDEGKELVQEMMSRGMLVDAAHMSEKSVRDLYDIAVANDYYPFYLSHGHFREVMTPEKREEEKTTPAWVIEMLRETGGVFGLRTAHEEVSSYTGSPVANSCHGSSRSFAQAYDFGRLGLKVPVALGSDFNGFIQQTRPRFGPDACSASFEQEAECQARDERMSGPAPLGADLDELGLAHVGTLPELLDDLDALGTDTAPLRSSADAVVRMWERAAGERSGPAAADGELDASGVVDEPPHAERLAEYPVECSEPYCPGGLQSGDLCRFDAQCESGTCVDPGPCGNPRGTCE